MAGLEARATEKEVDFTDERLAEDNIAKLREKPPLELIDAAVAPPESSSTEDAEGSSEEASGGEEGEEAETEQVEEERDQLLLDVDTLRRGIKSAGEDRDANVDALQKAADALPAPSTDSGQSASPKVARGE